MTLIIMEYSGKPRQIECESFEFRSNKVNNWIKVITESEKIMIYNVAVMKMLDD